ncbi:ankyrin repeat domain-containing protein [Streptomyces sp. NPDC090077]|uniref:ankyrin repeat domain-containing protein n=1 Tax=Streptomyces sp. NPDC090077 TaxID=3365938 RepID=UPI00380E3AEE
MGSGRELEAAVRRGDAEAVGVLLAAGADPDTPTEDGLTVLCLAVRAYDTAVAGALTGGGADPHRPLPDGTTPLVRAVDGGSPAMTGVLLGEDPPHLPEAERERLLAPARRWHRGGAEAGLRERAAQHGPVHEEYVEDSVHRYVEQLSLGGLTVRAGHGAVLTGLERAFGVLTPVDELVGRAVAHDDWEHVDWKAAAGALALRPDTGTFLAVTALRHDPDPVRREFLLAVFDAYRMRFYRNIRSRRIPFGRETADVLAAWATEGEEDRYLLAGVLSALGDLSHPDQRALGLRYAAHPSARVRAEVPDLLVDQRTWHIPPGAPGEVLLTLAADEDPYVRRRAEEILEAAETFAPRPGEDTPTADG